VSGADAAYQALVNSMKAAAPNDPAISISAGQPSASFISGF